MGNFFYTIRSKLHQMPEIGLKEYNTSKFIRDFLDDLKIEYECIGTSTVALFYGEGNRWVGYRADIDALPLQEEVESEYKSKIDGMMHACGHDGHTTNLLYFAKWIKEQVDKGIKLKKSILLIFQAGEEGMGGAKIIAETDFFKKKNIEAIYALHVYPDVEEGKIGLTSGYLSFQNINLDLEITGKGCHGAQPQKGIDSILIGAKLVEAYQSIVSRNISPFEPLVFTIGSFRAGTVRNVIPEKVNILGTIRLMNVDLIPLIKERVTNINEGFEKAYGIKIDMNFKPFYPPVYNSDELYKKIKNILPQEKIVENIKLSGSEDFSFYLQNGVKGCMFLLGIRNEEKGFVYPLHSPKFNFDPNKLKLGFEIFRDLLYELEVLEK